MSDRRTNRDANQDSTTQSDRPVRYPTNHVVGVVDTAEQLKSAVTALTGGGFLASEVEVVCGPAAADALAKSTGRTGLTNLAMRVAERFGVWDDEMEMKARYEQALRDGRFLVSTLAPTEERRALAARILEDHGGHLINFLGRFSIVPLHP